MFHKSRELSKQANMSYTHITLDIGAAIKAYQVVDLAKAMKNKENTIFVSSIVPRGDRWNAKVSITNRRIKELCAREELPFIDNNNIDRVHHLNRSNLHLNAEGTRLLANNFLRALGHY